MSEGRVIRVLPDEVIDQIAAGEVIERPASVVKELVENALDAGAGRITVEIEGGGRTLIRVLDDGVGMSAGQARLALVRHATSKLRAVTDLFALDTMGFRGEALPSIAAVSRMDLVTRSRATSEQPAVRLSIEGGRILREEDTGAPVGTQVEVRDLLFNVPARLKFLKGEATETGHVNEAVSRLAMAHPAVHFQLRNRGRLTVDAPPAPGALERVCGLLGARLADRLTRVERSEGGVRVEALLGAPELSQTTRRGLHLYVGRRWVRDRGLTQAVWQGYGELIPRGRFPTAVVFVEVDPRAVDVNVHPQKLEVRFSDAPCGPRGGEARGQAGGGGGAVAGRPRRDLGWAGDRDRAALVERRGRRVGAGQRGGPRLRQPALALAVLVAIRGHPAEGSRAEAGAPGPGEGTGGGGGWAPAAAGPGEGTGGGGGWAPAVAAPREGTAGGGGSAPATAASGVAAARGAAAGGSAGLAGALVAAGSAPVRSAPDAVGLTDGFFGGLRYLGQLDATYLVCERHGELVLVDQHAAHERVAFQRLRQRHGDRSLARQQLLLPQTVELDRRLAAAATDAAEALEAVGFEIEPFGDGPAGGVTIAVKAVPVGLRPGEEPLRFLTELLAELAEEGASRAIEERLDAVFATLACHSVVRAGDALSPAEVSSLLTSLDQVEFRSHCPHGRPVLLRIRIDEIARRFGRT